MHPSIVAFLKKHHLLTLATAQNSTPYCASCFYAFLEETVSFVIATDMTTRHGREALNNNSVAGTVAKETSVIGKIQGAQFTGIFREASKEEAKAYFKRFPYALVMNPSLWSIDINYLKFTDNTLGFGNKLEFTPLK